MNKRKGSSYYDKNGLKVGFAEGGVCVNFLYICYS